MRRVRGVQETIEPGAPDLDEIGRRVCQIAAEQLGLPLDGVGLDDRLIEDLHCDSLDLLELMMELEDAFGVTLPDKSPDPVYKAVFTRTPFRLRDFAELIYVRLRRAQPSVQAEWLAEARDVVPPVDDAPFSQLSGRLVQSDRNDTLLEEIGRNGAGFRLFRRRTDGMRCVLVPAATCDVGCNHGELDERPPHPVELTDFVIDAEPVSVTAFARFLNSVEEPDPQVRRDWFLLDANDRRQHHMPLAQVNGEWRPRPGTEQWPMILVSWFGANAYSLWANRHDWRGYRSAHVDAAGLSTLPSEAQWECAARGARHREYPWGDARPASTACFGQHRRHRDYDLLDLPLRAVNNHMGVSPFGLLHMAGNVWCWCADWYDPAFYERQEARQRNALNLRNSGVRSERGGSWIGTAALLRSSYRRGRAPHARGRCLGFRCISAPP